MMKTYSRLFALATASTLFAGTASATDITSSLSNPGFENLSDVFPGGFGWNGLVVGWDQLADNIPGGARHADAFATPASGQTPGTYFVYYTANGTYRFGEESSATFDANTVYTFSAFGSDNATHQLSIGYLNDSDEYVALADSATTTTVAGTWSELAPAVHTTSGVGDELGRNIVVFFGGPDAVGGSLWVDDVSLDASAVPEPGSLALVGLGALAALRRRRRA